MERFFSFGRMRNETHVSPGVFVFELGWDQVLVRLLTFRVSGLFLPVLFSRAVAESPS